VAVGDQVAPILLPLFSVVLRVSVICPCTVRSIAAGYRQLMTDTTGRRERQGYRREVTEVSSLVPEVVPGSSFGTTLRTNHF
jgi:hypothetical protein